MKIYTKTGDGGTTSLVGGTRTTKADLRIEAYGTVDELTAHLGYLHGLLPVGMRREELEWVLNKLMAAAGLLAADPERWTGGMPPIAPKDTVRLEEWTDGLLEGLPSLKHFTLPCGPAAVSYSHVCRTACRRAERCVVRMGEQFPLPPQVQPYLNRLSDYLYALGRRLTHEAGTPALVWNPECSEK